MTAIPEAVDPEFTDAALARAAAAGDRAAFAGIYDRYADRLHDYCVSMLRNRDAAADCVQDTFCTAATALPQLRDPDRLRPWLYSIARNEALRRIRDRKRELLSDEVPDMASTDAGPETLAARSELADLVAEAAGGLSDRDQSVLQLAYYHGLDGPELAEALDVSPGTANKMVQRLRDTIARSLGALLVCRGAQQSATPCVELSAIIDGWDGQFTVLMRKRVARHIEGCRDCDEERQRRVNPVVLLGATPVFIPAPASLRDRTLDEVRLPTETTSSDPTAAGVRKGARAAAVAGVLALVGAGVTVVWFNQERRPVVPVDFTEPQSTSTSRSLPPAEFRPPSSSGSGPTSTPDAIPLPTNTVGNPAREAPVTTPRTTTRTAEPSPVPTTTTTSRRVPVRPSEAEADEPADEQQEPDPGPESKPKPLKPQGPTKTFVTTTVIPTPDGPIG